MKNMLQKQNIVDLWWHREVFLMKDKGMLKVKLYAEYYQFKEEMQRLPPKDIFGNCYKIGEIWTIYEIMIAMAEVLSEEIIQELWEMPNI